MTPSQDREKTKMAKQQNVKVYVVVVGFGVRQGAFTRKSQADALAKRINGQQHPGGTYRASVEVEMWTPAELGR